MTFADLQIAFTVPGWALGVLGTLLLVALFCFVCYMLDKSFNN